MLSQGYHGGIHGIQRTHPPSTGAKDGSPRASSPQIVTKLPEMSLAGP